jgi:fused signal recognition particle receptor
MCGVDTTLKIIDRIQQRVKTEKYIGTSELNTLLRKEIAGLLSESNLRNFPRIFSLPKRNAPYVIMVVGVNGVGKTTTMVSLPISLRSQVNKCCSVQPILSGLPPLTS